MGGMIMLFMEIILKNPIIVCIVGGIIKTKLRLLFEIPAEFQKISRCMYLFLQKGDYIPKTSFGNNLKSN